MHKKDMNTSINHNVANSDVRLEIAQQQQQQQGCPTPPVVKKGKTVSFFETVQVVFIPCVQDYQNAGLFSSLWLEPNDYKNIQMSMGWSFRKFLASSKHSDLNQSLKAFIAYELANAEQEIVIGKRPVCDIVSSVVAEDMPVTKRIKV